MSIPRAVSAQKFDVDKESKSMYADMSDLGRNVFGQIYSDACDEGMLLFNAKTGKTTSWAVSDMVYSKVDHDLMYWKLTPLGESVARFPALQGWTLVIHND